MSLFFFCIMFCLFFFFFFFFNDTATTEIYTLSLHDALPICFSAKLSALRAICASLLLWSVAERSTTWSGWNAAAAEDRKSTRLNSSHSQISYAVFCLKKKKKQTTFIIFYISSHMLQSLYSLS